MTHKCVYGPRKQPFGAKTLPDLMLAYRQLNKNKYALFTTVTNHISNPLPFVHPICINSLMNFALELASHLLRVKQFKKNRSVIFHVDRPSVESTFELIYHLVINTLRPRQNGRHFPDYILKCIFWNENVCFSIKISRNFVPQGPISNIPALVQIMNNESNHTLLMINITNQI